MHRHRKKKQDTCVVNSELISPKFYILVDLYHWRGTIELIMSQSWSRPRVGVCCAPSPFEETLYSSYFAWIFSRPELFFQNKWNTTEKNRVTSRKQNVTNFEVDAHTNVVLISAYFERYHIYYNILIKVVFLLFSE